MEGNSNLSNSSGFHVTILRADKKKSIKSITAKETINALHVVAPGGFKSAM